MESFIFGSTLVALYFLNCLTGFMAARFLTRLLDFDEEAAYLTMGANTGASIVFYTLIFAIFCLREDPLLYWIAVGLLACITSVILPTMILIVCKASSYVDSFFAVNGRVPPFRQESVFQRRTIN
jgi:hypothetical protein